MRFSLLVNKSILFLSLSLIVSLTVPVFAANHDLPHVADDEIDPDLLDLPVVLNPHLVKSCSAILSFVSTKTAPAYAVSVHYRNVNYKITVAMIAPSDKSSKLSIQIFWSQGIHNRDLESFIKDRIYEVYAVTGGEESDEFSKMTTASMSRQEFEESVVRLQQELGRRFQSAGSPFSLMTIRARSTTPAIAEASRMMLNFLVRRRVIKDVEEGNTLLNSAHRQLIAKLTDRELRFFDYTIFDEVLSFEQDQLMQKLAERARSFVSEKDLDYGAIHDEIRADFVKIAIRLVAKQRSDFMPSINKLSYNLAAVLQFGTKFAFSNPHLFEMRVKPFSVDALDELGELVKRNILSMDNLEEYRDAVNALDVQKHIDSSSEEYLSFRQFQMFVGDSKKLILDMAYSLEPVSTSNKKVRNSSSDTFGVKLSKITPGNGPVKEGSSFFDFDTGVPNSGMKSTRLDRSDRQEQSSKSE